MVTSYTKKLIKLKKAVYSKSPENSLIKEIDKILSGFDICYEKACIIMEDYKHNEFKFHFDERIAILRIIREMDHFDDKAVNTIVNLVCKDSPPGYNNMKNLYNLTSTNADDKFSNLFVYTFTRKD